MSILLLNTKHRKCKRQIDLPVEPSFLPMLLCCYKKLTLGLHNPMLQWVPNWPQIWTGHAAAKSLQLCPTLCDPMDCRPPGSSIHGILQARILKWVAMPSSRGSSWPRDRTHISCVSCIGRRVLYHQCHMGSPEQVTVVPMIWVP